VEGCRSCATLRASRRKRSSSCGPERLPARGTLTATVRSSSGSRALYTVPNAPCPTLSITSKRPNFWPGWRSQPVVDPISSRKVEPHTGPFISSRGVSLATSMGLRQCGQRMCMGRPPGSGRHYPGVRLCSQRPGALIADRQPSTSPPWATASCMVRASPGGMPPTSTSSGARVRLFEAVVEAGRGAVTFLYASYGFAWSWGGRGHGTASLWAGDPNGPCFLEDEFTVQTTDGRPWVEWANAKGQSRWRPDSDEDEDDYVPKPEGEVWASLERLILQEVGWSP